MDVEFITLVSAILLQTLIFGISGYIADKVKNGGEFQLYKLVITFIYATIVAVIVVNSGIVDMISLGDFLKDPTAILSPVWMQYMFVYTGIMYFVNKYVDPFVAKTRPYQALARWGQNFSPGFTVTPAFVDGTSPFPVSLLMEASPHYGDNEVIEYYVDWMDGGGGMHGTFNKGFARVEHTYVFEKTPKYTGHTFYPFFMIKTKQGDMKEFNTELGRCCAIGVAAKEE
jgi:hypothetical protein